MTFPSINLQRNWRLTIILLGYVLIFGSITFVNHYLLRTYGWDLGINNNAIYDYAHFRWNDCMIMQPAFENVLSDHFSLYPLLVSPLYWVFGSWTMLVFQYCAVLFGGIGVFRFVKNKSQEKFLPELAMAFFFSFYGVYSALGFDYHDNVIGAMMVPWLFLYVDKQKWNKVFLFTVLLLIAKENMALWSFFIFLGLALPPFWKKEWRNSLRFLAFGLGSLVYFLCIVKWVIPALGIEGQTYLHFKYQALGSTMGEALRFILTKPFEAFALLFYNHSGDPIANYIKMETYVALLLSGAWVMLWRPHFIVMLLPILAQKMYNNDFGKWGINAHYSIEFAPILAIAVFTWVIENAPNKKKWAIGFWALAFGCTLFFLNTRVSLWYAKQQDCFYCAAHWQRDFDVNKVKAVLAEIPEESKVSAQSPLAPRLAFREYIYHYPHIANAEYIALLIEERNTYPQSQEEYTNGIETLKNNGEWIVWREVEGLLVLKRK
jgi:uncharacterized membrane protein